MTFKVDSTSSSGIGGPGALGAGNAAQVLSLLDQLGGRSLDAGTAQLVAQLTAELRGGAATTRKTWVELRSSDEFHEGFANVVEDLAAQLKREGQAKLTISYDRTPGGSTMTIELSGAPAAVESAEREISSAARGVFNNFGWEK